MIAPKAPPGALLHARHTRVGDSLAHELLVLGEGIAVLDFLLSHPDLLGNLVVIGGLAIVGELRVAGAGSPKATGQEGGEDQQGDWTERSDHEDPLWYYSEKV